MVYRVTYSTPSGANRVLCSDPAEALAKAIEVAVAASEDVWIGDEEGHLFTIREFEKFMDET